MIPAPDLARLAELMAAATKPLALPADMENLALFAAVRNVLPDLLATAQDHARMAEELAECKVELHDALCPMSGRLLDRIQAKLNCVTTERDALQADLTALRARKVALPHPGMFGTGGLFFSESEIRAMLTNAGIGVTP